MFPIPSKGAGAPPSPSTPPSPSPSAFQTFYFSSSTMESIPIPPSESAAIQYSHDIKLANALQNEENALWNREMMSRNSQSHETKEKDQILLKSKEEFPSLTMGQEKDKEKGRGRDKENCDENYNDDDEFAPTHCGHPSPSFSSSSSSSLSLSLSSFVSLCHSMFPLIPKDFISSLIGMENTDGKESEESEERRISLDHSHELLDFLLDCEQQKSLLFSREQMEASDSLFALHLSDEQMALSLQSELDNERESQNISYNKKNGKKPKQKFTKINILSQPIVSQWATNVSKSSVVSSPSPSPSSLPLTSQWLISRLQNSFPSVPEEIIISICHSHSFSSSLCLEQLKELFPQEFVPNHWNEGQKIIQFDTKVKERRKLVQSVKDAKIVDEEGEGGQEGKGEISSYSSSSPSSHYWSEFDLYLSPVLSSHPSMSHPLTVPSIADGILSTRTSLLQSASQCFLRGESIRGGDIMKKVHSTSSSSSLSSSSIASLHCSSYEIFRIHNLNSHFLSSFSCDLHGLTVRESILIIQFLIWKVRDSRCHGPISLDLIVGVGHHSAGGKGRLEPAIRAWVDNGNGNGKLRVASPSEMSGSGKGKLRIICS